MQLNGKASGLKVGAGWPKTSCTFPSLTTSRLRVSCSVLSHSLSLSLSLTLTNTYNFCSFPYNYDIFLWQAAKPETVEKVCSIVRKQLALSDDIPLTPDSKFSDFGADSLDTVILILIIFIQAYA